MVIVLSPILTLRYVNNKAPEGPIISLSEFQAQQTPAKSQIVIIPENTVIPVNIQVSGDLFKNNPKLVLPLQLNKPIQMVLVDGKPTRRVKFADDADWRNSTRAGWVHIPWFHAEMTADSEPVINTNLIVNLQPN
jgi:hypothetical protein